MFKIAGTADALLPPISSNRITIGTLLAACDAQPSKRLLFSRRGSLRKASYDVTEVKAGKFATLDSNGNPAAWSEIVIQIVAVTDDDRPHMSAEDFAAITRQACNHSMLELAARLTFEVSDGVAPMQLYCADFPKEVEHCVEVSLVPLAASRKPLERKVQPCTCCAPSLGIFACR